MTQDPWTTATSPLGRQLPNPHAYLQSIVETARSIFDAQASSVFLLEATSNELVFAAVAGRGEDHLVGKRYPIDTGIAGWVASTGEAMVVDDLAHDAVFDRHVAESTGFVPNKIIAVPIATSEAVLGVIEVLDPVHDGRGSLSDLDILGRFAQQAAIAMCVLESASSSASTIEEGVAAFRSISDVSADDLKRVSEVLGVLSRAKARDRVTP